MGESLVDHIPSKENITDLLTKVLYGEKRRYLVSNILYDIHDNHMSSMVETDQCIQTSLIPLVILSNLRGLDQCIHVINLDS